MQEVNNMEYNEIAALTVLGVGYLGLATFWYVVFKHPKWILKNTSDEHKQEQENRSKPSKLET